MKVFLSFCEKNVIIYMEVSMRNKINGIFIPSILIFLFIAITSFVPNINIKNGKLIELTLDNVVEKIENKEDFVLCISRTTCSHCYDYKPKLESVAKENNINIYYIDVDKYDEDKFSDIISFNGSTPTTIFIKNGEEATTSNRINGDVSKTKIIDKLKSNGFID